MRRLLILVFVVLFLGFSAETRARSKKVVVLEYRANVQAATRISDSLAAAMIRQTSHEVISPSEARRRQGAVVDAEVAHCKGAPICIARIGRRLGCDEVILVGISQLGDLILAIQRIDAASGRVLGRLADSLRPRRRIDPRSINRYLRRLLPPGDFKRYGQIVIQTRADGDLVSVDEQPRGKTPLPPLKVAAPGRYSIRVQRPGHSDFVARIDVLPNALVEVTPTMNRLSAPPRWYQRWWVWALVGGVVAGTVTAIAITSASPGPESVPAVIRLGP